MFESVIISIIVFIFVLLSQNGIILITSDVIIAIIITHHIRNISNA